MSETEKNVLTEAGVKPADVARVAGLIGDQNTGRINGIEMLSKIRAYYESDIREQVAREIECVAAGAVRGYEEPVFVDAAHVARHGSLVTPPTQTTGDDS